MSLVEQHELSMETDLNEFPLLVDSFECWNRWRDGAPAPRWGDIEMMDLPTKLLPSTIVVDVIDGGRDLRFRYWGSALVDLYGAELTGSLFSESIDTLFGNLPHKQYQRVIDEGRPLLFNVTIRRPNNMMAQRINLRLPVIDANDEVSKVMTLVQLSSHKLDPAAEDWR